MAKSESLKIKIQILCGEEIAMGPGKADLLEAIDRHGSISAAARSMNMSYRRAWLLVDAMNRCWSELLVETSPGRARAGGARLTTAGRQIFEVYRAAQTDVQAAVQGSRLGTMTAQLRDTPRPPRTARD